MKRNHLYLLPVLLFVTAGFTACIRDRVSPAEPEKVPVTLHFSTRAENNGSTSYENAIQEIRIYAFSAGSPIQTGYYHASDQTSTSYPFNMQIVPGMTDFYFLINEPASGFTQDPSSLSRNQLDQLVISELPGNGTTLPEALPASLLSKDIQIKKPAGGCFEIMEPFKADRSVAKINFRFAKELTDMPVYIKNITLENTASTTKVFSTDNTVPQYDRTIVFYDNSTGLSVNSTLGNAPVIPRDSVHFSLLPERPVYVFEKTTEQNYTVSVTYKRYEDGADETKQFQIAQALPRNHELNIYIWIPDKSKDITFKYEVSEWQTQEITIPPFN